MGKRNLSIRVTGFWGLTHPGEPGKSWNFMLTFARTGESWKKDYRSWKFLKISFTQVIKFSELILKKCL